MQKWQLGFVLAGALTLAGFSSAASAAANGLYGGAELGYGDIDTSAGHLFPFTSDTANDGLAGRLFSGYQFNKYLAAEGGWGFQEQGFLKATNQYDFDLAAKGMWPITQTFGLYGKVGAAYVDQSINGGSTDGVRPLYGLGLSYDMTPKVSTTLGWTRIVGGGSIQDSNFVMLGAAYHL